MTGIQAPFVRRSRRPPRGATDPFASPGAQAPSRAVLVLGVAAVAATFALLLWVALARHPVGDYYTESDFYGGYAAGARAIQHGVIDPARYPVVGPGFEFALALFGAGGADLFLVGKLISVCAATATLGCWLVLIRRRIGAAEALWTVLFVAANPVFFRYGYSATTDMLGTGLVAGSIAVLLGTERRYSAALAGALAGLATLTRYNAIALVPAALLGFAGLVPGIEHRRRAALTWIAGFLAITAPWALYSLAGGHVPGINLYRNFGFYLNPDPSRNVQDEYGFLANAKLETQSLLTLLRTQPLHVLGRALANVPDHLWRDLRELLGPLAATLAGLGAATAVGARWRALTPIGLQGVMLFSCLAPVFYSDRYSMVLAPIYLVFAGLLVAGHSGPIRRVPSALRGVLGAVALVALVARSVPYQAHVLALAPVETRVAGLALARIAARGDRVIARKGHVGYYSGLTVIPFPRFKTLAELAGFARGHGAHYLYFSWYEVLLRQEFAYLLDTTAVVPGLEVVSVTTDKPSVVYAIGPEFGRNPDWIADVAARRLHNARALVQVLPDSLAWTHRMVLGAEALAENRPAEALRHAGNATQARPHDALGWTLAGEALRQLGRASDARAAFEHALALDPDDVQAQVGLGYVELESGAPARAAAAWRPAIGRTTNPNALETMAALFDSLGDSEAARAARARRVALAP